MLHLNFKKIGDSGDNIIILHGLLGSLDNWHSIAKQLSETHQVFIIDQRNHGRSPHTDDIDYTLLANDIVEFCEQQQIRKSHIVGHSMGGKVAMMLALTQPELVDKLVVVDIAPTFYAGGHEEILFAMAEAPLKMATRRDEIDNFLQNRIRAFGERQFILKNLSRDANGHFELKCNLPSLIKNYRLLMDFPKTEQTFSGNIFFIKGELSNYINQDNFDACDKYFPNHKLIEVPNAGHWVHADNPIAFMQALKKIL